jgi:SAM-dependent methyltransferase
MTEPNDAPILGDPDKPAVARMYDYLLGGTYNLPIDRIAVDHLRLRLPEFADIAWANRGFLQRAARWLAEAGIDQFIDVGAGLPTANSTHEAVQKSQPDARIVYVDNNPDVVAAATRLLIDVDTVTAVAGDLRRPEDILGDPAVRSLIDFTRPVAVLMVAVVHFVPDADDPAGLIRRYVDRLAPGSYLALSHATFDRQPASTVAEIDATYATSTNALHARSKAEVTKLFDGLEMVPPWEGAEPGLAFLGEWGAEDPVLADSDGSRWGYAAVARKP